MSSRLTKTLQLIIILLVPVLIVFTATRFLTTDRFLAYEYGRAGFPPDPFGFTERQRFVLASTNVHYVLAHLPDDELAKQTQDGVPVYSSREVTHMADVRAVFLFVMRTWQGSIILFILTGLTLWQRGRRKELVSAIRSGGILTTGLIGSITLVAFFAWQSWFENFHLLFFKPGSWLFSYSGTLIRLFPLQFWMDATFIISTTSFVGGLSLAIIGWRWERVQSSPVK
ncbi:MAG TPA: TIGR01906 family membrane protein [Anaerolineales bacterium]|nr:TIGR01906 family membrane protein [Anaerolineales bacterium]